MCNWVSAIMTEGNDLIIIPGLDSHSEIIAAAGVSDDHNKVVRLEYQPKFRDLSRWIETGVLDQDDWMFTVDQDMIPEWFDREAAKSRMWRRISRMMHHGGARGAGKTDATVAAAAPMWWPNEHDEQGNQFKRTRLPNGDFLAVACANVLDIRARQYVGRLIDSHVHNVEAGAVVDRTAGSIIGQLMGTVNSTDANTVIHSVYASGEIRECGGVVRNLDDSSVIRTLTGTGRIRHAQGQATIHWQSGRIARLAGKARLYNCGSVVELLTGQAQIMRAQFGGFVAKVEGEAIMFCDLPIGPDAEGNMSDVMTVNHYQRAVKMLA